MNFRVATKDDGVASNSNMRYHEYIDSEHPLELSFYIDEDTVSIKEIKLDFVSEIVHQNELNSDINNILTIFVDGVEKVVVKDMQGGIDLTAWVTTTGWHKVALHSSDLIKITAQLTVRSFVGM